MPSTHCIVLLTNNAFFDKMLYTLYNLKKYGYSNNICIVVGDDLVNSEKLKHPLLLDDNVIIKYFPDIKFTENFLNAFNTIERPPYCRQKLFQYHKLHLFNTFFKQWNYILYIDSGVHIFDSVEPILNSKKENKFLAHSDAYPQFQWKLKDQFIDEGNIFNKLTSKYNLNIDYPQTTIMLYDTAIINHDTFDNLVKLAEEYNISKTNDQGIIALYFTVIKNCWEQLQLGDDKQWYYDYLLRPDKSSKRHIILKML